MDVILPDFKLFAQIVNIRIQICAADFGIIAPNFVKKCFTQNSLIMVYKKNLQYFEFGFRKVKSFLAVAQGILRAIQNIAAGFKQAVDIRFVFAAQHSVIALLARGFQKVW